MSETPPNFFTFRYRQRLHGSRAFDAVFNARCRKNLGPLSILTRPNDLTYNRLGLVVPRRVGSAPKRHRIKRMIREAFRLGQHEVPAGYDMVIVVRPHTPATLEEYRDWLAQGLDQAQREWGRRRRREQERDVPSTPPPTSPPSESPPPCSPD